MKETGIIMSGNHPKLILDGIKTQTRRILANTTKEWKGKQPIEILPMQVPNEWVGLMQREPNKGLVFKCRYGQVGDRLWLKHRYDLFDVYYKPIVGYEGLYSASTDGHIYRNEHQLKEVPTSEKGYLCVSLSKNGDIRTQNVHRLICRAFYGQPSMADAQVRHMDGNPQNNNPSNLDWGTQTDNWLDRKYHGRGMGEAHHASKLTHSQAMDIRQSTKSQRQLAYIYNVSQSTIQAVKAERYWQDKTLQPSRNYPIWTSWKSPLFMPRWASRITLEITEVRVERLNSMTESDAHLEGVDNLVTFMLLWDRLNKKRGYEWTKNCWVWVITFKLCQ